MKRLIYVFAILLISSCADVGSDMFAVTQGPAKTVDITDFPSIRVVGVTVEIPETLRVSEQNGYRPDADIVWRGDPFGDRYAQVKAIFDEAIARGVADLNGELPVTIYIKLGRFHALTERTRYSIGGVHDIDFLLSVTDQRSGEIIVPAYLVNSQFKAFGGETALTAERLGLTQKIRISEHLARLIHQELTGIPAVPMPTTVLDEAADGTEPPVPESEA